MRISFDNSLQRLLTNYPLINPGWLTKTEMWRCWTAHGLSQSVPLGHISSSYGNTLRQTLENAKISFMGTQGNLSLFVKWNIGFAESMLMSPERVVSGLMLDMGAHRIRERKSKIIMVILSWNLQHPHQSNLNNMGDRVSDGKNCRTWVE